MKKLPQFETVRLMPKPLVLAIHYICTGMIMPAPFVQLRVLP